MWKGVVGGLQNALWRFPLIRLQKVEPRSVCFSGWLRRLTGLPHETALNAAVSLNVTAADAGWARLCCASAALHDYKNKKGKNLDTKTATCSCHVLHCEEGWILERVWVELCFREVRFFWEKRLKSAFSKSKQLCELAAERGFKNLGSPTCVRIQSRTGSQTED